MGYIDKTGKYVVNLLFDYGHPFAGRHARVKISSRRVPERRRHGQQAVKT